MKITTDVKAGSIPVRDVSSQKSSFRSSSLNLSNLTESFASKFQRDRAIAEALAMAQASRQIIQKALFVSTRLKDAALEAMTTGRANIDEISRDIGGIQGYLSNYGESISISFNREAFQGDRALLKGSLDKIKNYSLALSEGKNPAPDTLSTVAKELKSLLEKSNSTVESYSSYFPGIKLSGEDKDFIILNQKTSLLISKEANIALTSQAGLNKERVSSLTTG